MVDDNTNVKLITNLDMNLARIRNVGAPVDSQEAANKQYVDSGVATLDRKINTDVADCLTDAKAYADSIGIVAGAPDWTRVVNKPSYLDTNGPISMDSQGVLIVDTNMSLAGNTLRDVADPALPNDAANKDYVDLLMSQAARPALVRSMIDESSALDRRWTNITDKPTWVGKMDYIATPTTANTSGLRDNFIHVKTNVDMDGQTIAGLVNPTHASHAVPLRYLDTKLSELRTRIDEGPATGVLQHITRDSETLPTKILVDLPIEFPAASRKRIRGVEDFGTTEDHSYDAVNKRYVDAQIAAGGGGANPYADFLTVNGTELAIANLKAPTAAKNPSTKEYADEIERKAMLAGQMSMDMNGRMLFKPIVEFTSPANGRMRFNATVVLDRAYGFQRTAGNNYKTNSNFWINKVTVRASVFIEGASSYPDFRETVISDPLILQTMASPTNVVSYIWDFEMVSGAFTYKTIEISDDYTNKTVIVKVTPIVEGYALPAGQFHSIPNGGLTAYRSAPAGVKFTYTLPHHELRYE